MHAYRIHLTSWTASFRYPNLISGFQPSLAVPPLATIYGLISAAAGRYICAHDLAVGFVFSSDCQAIDLETIYQFSSKGSRLVTKPNIIRRQILYDNDLWLYLAHETVAKAFETPYFQLLMGRSSDLATVMAVDVIELSELTSLNHLKGTLVPMGFVPLPAPIQALPVGFTDEIPRKGMEMRPFFILDYDFDQQESIAQEGFFDRELNHQIYWHDYTRT